MKHPLFVLSISSVLLSGSIAFAHHGWGSYDASKQFSIDSSVQQTSWQNPHVTLAVMHDNRSWEAILAPPFRMSARGLAPDMLKPGTQVTIEGYPSTRVENEMRAERIIIGDKTFELR